MERVVGRAHLAAASVRVLERLEPPGDLLDLAGGGLARRAGCRFSLEDLAEGAQVVDRLLLQQSRENFRVEGVLALDPDHRRPAPGTHLDEAQRHERLDGLADGVTSDPVLLHQHLLGGQAVTGPELARANPLEDCRTDRLAERLASELHRRSSYWWDERVAASRSAQ